MGRSTYEKEMLAILHAIEKWRHYLLSSQFIIKIDHSSLKLFLEQRFSYPEQNKWLTKLLGYDFVIEYKKRKENVVADALSRQFENEVEIKAISGPCPQWLSQLQEEWSSDPETSQIIQELKQGSAKHPQFTYEDTIL